MSNAYTIYLLQENSPEKFGLMLHGIIWSPGQIIKASAVKDEYASYYLDGKVTAYHGDDR